MHSIALLFVFRTTRYAMENNYGVHHITLIFRFASIAVIVLFLAAVIVHSIGAAVV